MVNNPPTKRLHRWVYRGIFLLLGIAIVALTFMQQSQESRKESNHAKELAQSRAEISNLKKEMHQQFHDLLNAFSTNSAIDPTIRLAALENQLRKISEEGNELQKRHELFNVSGVDITRLRAERANDLALQENQRRQAEIQSNIDDIQRKQAEQRRIEAERQSQQKAEEEALQEARTLSSPILPVFDYVINKLAKMLDGIANDSGEKRFSDFSGTTPTIYASGLENKGTIVNGTNVISIGTNSAWNFEISTTVLPIANFRMGARTFATIRIESRTTNTESVLTIRPTCVKRTDDRYTAMRFQAHNISGDIWFNQMSIQLSLPNGLNINKDAPLENYTDDIDKALRRLIEAQDQQCPLNTVKKLP